MIKIVDLRKSFDGQEVLRGVNLEIPGGKRTAIIGRSGCGKSVLLKHIIGLLKPDRGWIYIDGEEITRLKGEGLNRIKRKFGVVFQGGALFDSLTIYENVAFPLKELTHLGDKEIRERVEGILEEVGLLEMKDKYPDEISGGMRKRVAIARAIIMEPEILVFDEPTTGLDPVTTKTIHTLMMGCSKKTGCTEIIVTHRIKEVLEIAHFVAMLHEGRIIEFTTPKELIASKNPIVRDFITGKADTKPLPLTSVRQRG